MSTKKRKPRAASAPRGKPPRTPRQAFERAARLHRRGELDAAEALYRQVLEQLPEQPDALHLLGVLRHQRGDGDGALDLLGRAARLDPDNADLHSNLGNVLSQLGRDAAAAAAYREALAVRPKHAEALHNLGLLYKRRGELDDALDALAGAVAVQPRPAYLLDLAALQLDRAAAADAADSAERARAAGAGGADALLGRIYATLRRPADAAAALRRALAADAGNAELWLQLGRALADVDDAEPDQALDAYRRAIALRPDFGLAYINLGVSLNALGRDDEAAQIWRDWLAAVPDQPTARHMLAAAAGGEVPVRAGDAYVRELFDAFAATFDSKLASLDYRAPRLVTARVAALYGERDAALDVLDAGCGTGLCGPALRRYARRLVGVDLSAGMLERAAALGCYDELVEAELSAYLADRAGRYDLIVVADTLVYFGALETVLGALAGALKADGRAVLTFEAGADDERYVLQPHGRYRHGLGYIEHEAAAAGLALSEITRATLREEARRPVPGWVVTAAPARG